MSDAATTLPEDREVCCEICGFPIEEQGQECPAQTDGRCWA